MVPDEDRDRSSITGRSLYRHANLAIQGHSFKTTFRHVTSTRTREGPYYVVMLSPWRSICVQVDDEIA